ncbi:cupin domain-containing protein [Porphyrobacter sp. YT40]|uniref:cupin domain-containing protein n=1 Tax=Porphyrobacter sp. YT40 TaxID=2547601 RepID=UPI001144DF0E|nr:cupin domain-containing protein [Porphyrobacter sp. YT40]QDH35806.1 cupin domain-containing protein [Porphyrobacter sp. YT40]
MSDSAQKLIEQLGLAAHPEGGWYRETWRGEPLPDGRANGTAIIFLLRADEASHWHTVDAAELWLWQAGDPVELRLAASDEGPARSVILGSDVVAGQQLQGLVAPGEWQAARPYGAPVYGYSIVSCVVVPGFDFAGFRLAAPGWEPGSGVTP